MRRESKAPASGTAVTAYGRPAGSVLPARLGLVLLALLGAALLYLPSSALAAKKYQLLTAFPPTEYPNYLEWTPNTFNGLRAESVAINDKNGHIYVADSGRAVIFDYSSLTDKTPARWDGTTTPAGSFGGEHVSVAVDNTTGDVYVADRTHAVVDKFDEDGNLIASFGDSSPSHNGQLAGLDTPAASFKPPQSYYASFPIAVDQATHDLYVADPGHSVVDIFDESGAYLKQITATAPPNLYREGGEYITGIAVNAKNHNVYLTDWAGPNLVFQFDASGNYVRTLDGSNTTDGNFEPGTCTGCSLISVAAEDSTGNIFVGAMAHEDADVFDENGNFLPPSNSFAEAGYVYAAAVAIDQATGYLYESNSYNVNVFKPVIVPTVTINPASELTTTSAKFSGHVDPATGEGGGPVTKCQFEYETLYQFSENPRTSPWNGAQVAPCSPNPTTSPTDVSATVTGLTPGLEYRYRLVSANSEGGNDAAAPAFATVGHYRVSSSFGSLGTGDGQLKEPLDVAVNYGTGDIYVADAGNHRVDQFSSSGSFIRAFGADVGGAGVDVCTSGCQAGTAGTSPGQLTEPKFIDIDNSAGPSAGDVYVADGSDRVVQKFDSSGHLITSWESGGETQFAVREGTIGGTAVDNVGNLYVVTDSPPYYWTVISQDGGSRKQYPTNGEWFGGERLELGTPGGSGIEVGPGENWYETEGVGSGDGVRYSSAAASIYNTEGVYKQVYGIELVNSGLTIDSATGDLFVSQGGHVDRFAGGACIPPDAGCKPSDSIGSGQLGFAAGLANQPSNGDVYAADRGKDEVAVITPLPLPKVTTGPATEVTPTSGNLTGHVDPGGAGTISSCEFEYLDGPVRNEVQTLNFSKVTKEGTFTLSFEGQTTKPISYERTFFEAGSIQFRLEELSTIGTGGVHVTEVFDGPFLVEFAGQFTDLNVPAITADGSGLVPPSATLTAETRYDGNGWSYSVTKPCSPAAPLSSPTDVSASLTNLTPFNTYHYRLMAARSDGEGLVRIGEERGFTPTPTAAPAIDGTSTGSVTPTSATLQAKVNPRLSPTVYRFEYGIDTSYGSLTPSSASIGEDETDHSVSTELAELAPGRTYHYRALATNLNGSTRGPDETFSTPDRPSIAAASASDISATGATLSARIRPGFRPTTYHFEYGRTAAFGATTPESASIGADNNIYTASSAISGLLPGTGYHFRVVASNEIGIADSAEGEFTTGTAGSPPPPPKEPARCRSGLVMRHGKCVKKPKKHKKHRHGRKAGHA